jgi:hypothetical protein
MGGRQPMTVLSAVVEVEVVSVARPQAATNSFHFWTM